MKYAASDEHDAVFAEATLTAEFVKKLPNLLYEIAVEKGQT